ncbi:MAG: amidase [Calditrichaeota bacterium]|nr:MAG: amidase [Calditrichota bacterium]MBL1204861.1 amidase [Calditrichota bacterium]NOG44690.1 amidase [Calditrichota bacterium]
MNFSKSALIIFVFLVLQFLISCDVKVSYSKVGSFELDEITISEIQNAYENGTYTIRQVVQLYIDRIDEIDRNGPKLNSIIIVNPDALALADDLDKELAAGKSRGPLHGIPVILKDNIDTHDKMPTTAGSRVLKDSYPPQDSDLAKKLREAGAIILAKANLSEWANYRGSFSSSGWSGVGGQTNNPYVLDRNPCGSSAGSAVAVSANLCAVAIGTETWGSIMCPSNANGIVGIKPTVGLWSRSGIVPISETQDTAGPMARTVSDAAILLSAGVGIDSSDAKTFAGQGKFHSDYRQFLNKDGLKGKRIGYLKNAEGTHFKVDSLMHRAVRFLKNQGAEIVEIEKLVEGRPYSNSSIVLAYEFKDGLKKYFERLGNGAPVANLEQAINATLKDSLEMLYFNLGRMENAQSKGDLETKEYKEALEKMLKAYRDEGIDKVMDSHQLDAIVSPTGGPAWKTDMINGDNFVMSTSVNAALSGYPNINVPMGFIGEVPVGISFFGRAWSEPVLLEIAFAYEQGTQHRKAPKFLETD